MSGLQRRHHGHQVVSNETNNDLDGNYNPKSKSSTRKQSSWPLLIGVTAILAIIFYTQSNTNYSNTSKSVTSNDLNLITVYPWPIASTIHKIEGKTEILITNNNRESVLAIRTSIVMANSLRRRRRRKSVLLKFTAFIASLGSRSGEVVDGDIELEAYGEVKMREYLLEHGDKCWDDNGGGNAIFQRYSEIVDTIISVGDDEERINELWDDAINLFAWCQFANSDARGYIAHGTNLKSQDVLEESRLKGVGLIGPDNTLIDGTHYSQLFIIPSGNDDDLLRSHLSESWSTGRSLSDSTSETSLLFGIKDRDLDRWSEQWTEDNRGRDGDWLLFK